MVILAQCNDLLVKQENGEKNIPVKTNAEIQDLNREFLKRRQAKN